MKFVVLNLKQCPNGSDGDIINAIVAEGNSGVRAAV